MYNCCNEEQTVAMDTVLIIDSRGTINNFFITKIILKLTFCVKCHMQDPNVKRKYLAHIYVTENPAS